MSLLLLKTKDLTWQDHTLNTEVMLAPARSVLLLNKHKTLDAKCEQDRQLFERQRVQCVKDFMSSRRLIVRQRMKLVHKQRELGTKQLRVHSAPDAHAQAEKNAVDAGAAGSVKERSASAPGSIRFEGGGVGGGVGEMKRGLPAIYIDTGNRASPEPSETSSFFVTELASETSEVPPHLPSFPQRRSRLPSTPISGKPPSTAGSKLSGASSPASFVGRNNSVPGQTNRTRSVFELRRQRSHRPSILSVRFAQPSPYNDDDDEDDDDDYYKREAEAKKDHRESMKDEVLEGKVRDFVEEISDFNNARKLGLEPRDRLSYPGKRDVTTPLVAKRYNSWDVDQHKLLDAFDKFCEVQTREELNKVVRLAGKLKANVKVTRNQSIIPSIATFKATRSFKALSSRSGSRASTSQATLSPGPSLAPSSIS